MNARTVAVMLGFGLLVTMYARAGGPMASEESRNLGPLTGLVGTWESESDMDHDGTNEPFSITFKISGGGSALVETMMPGTDHEMVTVYTRDGSDLVLTHYCMLGNQPRMRTKSIHDKELKFDFQDATGMSSGGDMHMHSLIVDFIDADHAKETWSLFDKGVKKSDDVFMLTRKK